MKVNQDYNYLTHSSTQTNLIIFCLFRNDGQNPESSQAFAQIEFEKSTISLKTKNEVYMAVETRK